MFATNGFRMFDMTRSTTITRARKAIANYQAHLDRGVSAKHAAALRLFIKGQEEMIAEWQDAKFNPAEW